VKLFKFYVFLSLWDTTREVFFRCGIQRKSFFLLWDTTEKVFLRCGIQQKRIFSVVGYNGEQSQDGKQIFFYCIPPTMQEIFLLLYPTPQQNLVQCTVSQKNLQHCIPQRRRFSSVVSHNGRYFPPLWDTTEEVFFRCGIQRKKFFPLWDITEEVFFRCGIQWKKNIQRRMIFLNFKYLSWPSNKNFGKISYLNCQTNPWKELKMENYMVNHEKKFFSHCGIQRSRDFLNF
jgi:hypothetical protein